MAGESEDPQGQVTAETRGAICCITIDNPPRMNALNSEMWEALPRQIADAESDPEVRVIVLRGAGTRAFSAGADISEFDTARTGAQAKHYDALNHSAFEAVAHCAKPTIAMIWGYCLGGGLEIAICCDLRVAATGASFAIPAAKLGIGYDVRWVRPLLTALSPAAAKELLFTGRRFSDQEALAMGLINQLHAPEELEAAALAVADEIATNAPLSVYAAKRAIDAMSAELQPAKLAELDALVAACFESDDYEEGRAAFAEKRKPQFRGR